MSLRKAVLNAAASRYVSGGTRRVLVRPSADALAITAIPHLASGAPPGRAPSFASASMSPCIAPSDFMGTKPPRPLHALFPASENASLSKKTERQLQLNAGSRIRDDGARLIKPVEILPPLQSCWLPDGRRWTRGNAAGTRMCFSAGLYHAGRLRSVCN